jgi:hypothetical protein
MLRGVQIAKPIKEMAMARERIDTTPGEPGGQRYIRRDDEGQFTEDQVDVGRSSAADQRQQAENKAKPGEGDRGDR